MDARTQIDAQIQLRRDLDAVWRQVDPVLRDGEVAYSKDILRMKVGDGTGRWSELPYLPIDSTGETVDLTAYAKKEDLITLSNLLVSMWSLDDDGNLVTDKQVIIKNNLIVKGDTASGGPGGGSSSVGIQGIVVNGVTYRDTDGDGLIDLGTIGGGTITEITSAMITEALGYTPANSASLGSLAYKDSVAWSEVTGKVTSAGVFSFIDSTFALPALWFNYRTLQNTNLTTPIESYHMGNGAIGYAGVVASKFTVNGGTSSQFLKADGSLDSTSYLSTAGGRTSDLTIEGSGTAWLAFGNSSGTSFGSIGVNSSHEPKFWNGAGASTIYHTGNFNPADYLPLSGGTITSPSHEALVINRTGGYSPYLSFYSDGVTLGCIGFDATSKDLIASIKGATQTLIHSGNIGSQKVASATKLATARTIWGQPFDGTADIPMTSSAAMRLIYFRDSVGTGNAGVVGRGGSDNTISLYTYTGSPLVFGTNSTERMRITNGGNVLIGTTNDSGSKLFVNGVTRASAFRSNNIGIECDADGNTTGYGSEINRFGSNLYLQGRGGNLYLSHSEGTTFIRGLASITGAVTMASTLSVGGASTFNGDVRINGNLVVTGDTASGGGNLRVDYNAMWALINKTSITQAEMDAVGFTTAVVNNLAIGAYHKIVGELGDYKYVYNYECRDLGGSIQLHIYFGDDNIDNCERFYFERSAGTWTLNFYEV